MKNNKRKYTIGSLLFFLLIFYVFLKYPKQTGEYAYIGLNIWYQNMIVSLLPIMFFIQMLYKTNLYIPFFKPIYRLLNPIFRIPLEGIFVIVFGFLSGFPLGAKLCCELYKDNVISKDLAEYLLCFCNNIGPAYFNGFVLSTILPFYHFSSVLYAYFCMYGIPIFYGILLRYTIYKTNITMFHPKYDIPDKNLTMNKKKEPIKPLLAVVPSCLEASLNQITMLGGYMIICNALRTPFSIYLKGESLLIAHCILEISGGLKALQIYDHQNMMYPVWVLSLLSFGGICCFFQTAALLTNTKLSIKKYMLHKIILCSITFLISFLLYVLLS